MINPQLQLANEFVQNTDRNIFLTGKAGTGKTTFLHNLKQNCPKRMVVVAPTGVAAINAGGITIHSFFQLPFGPNVPATLAWDKDHLSKSLSHHKMGGEKIKLIKSLDLLVIDEISMVRADTLDAIDEVLRRYRTRSKPFGGVQLLMIGDLHQLSPVVKDDEWAMLSPFYNNMYFFNSRALAHTQTYSVELKHIYRQTDTYFIDILNAVRENRIDAEVLEKLNQRYIPNFEPKEDEGYITLSSHNRSADKINLEKLKGLKGKSHHYKAKLEGDFPESSYPNAFELEFKIGAQVMFVKNDTSRDKLYYNGKIGQITHIKEDLIFVKCPNDLQEIAVGRVEWQNIKYELNNQTKEIEEKLLGSFFHYPLKLAWAITIHKSQGLTFEKAIIDANSSFAHGQVYVALSRCKSFEGMVLQSPIGYQSVRTDGVVSSYTKNAEENEPGETHLQQSKVVFQYNLLQELFDFNGLKYVVFMLKKYAQDHNNTISLGFFDAVTNVWETAESMIFAHSEKFKKQLSNVLTQTILPEEDVALMNRVKKGSVYFLDKLTVLNDLLYKVSFDSDNKSVKKQIDEALVDFDRVLFVKQAALKQAEKGFNTLVFLKIKANAEIDFMNSIKAKPVEKKEKISSAIKHPELYQTIKNWRLQLANENNIAAFKIFSQQVLAELVNNLPNNFAELESIKGIGKTKSKQFGNELLSMIAEYCDKQDISRTPFQLFVKTQSEKIDTKKQTLTYFKEGKSIKEIAEIRSLTSNTIEGHLASFIETGEISVFDVVDKEKVTAIEQHIRELKPISITQIKEAMPADFSYGEIKAVMAYVNKEFID